MRVKFFNYEIIDVKPITDIEEFKNHNRLRVFYHKGCKCVNCGKAGTKIGLGKDKSGGLHWDIYDDNFVPLNVDHILPRSKGGSDDLDNLQPMCVTCNKFKGNRTDLVVPFDVKVRTFEPLDDNVLDDCSPIQAGDLVFNANNFKLIGYVKKVIKNKVTIYGKPETSLYPINSLGKKKRLP